MGSLVEYAVTDRVPALAQQGPGRCLFCGSRARIEFQLLYYLDTYDVQVAWLPYGRSGKHWITSGEQRIGVVIRISGEQGEEHVLFNFQRTFGCLRLCSLPPCSGPLHPQAFLSLRVQGAVGSCDGISRPPRKPVQPPSVCVAPEAAFDSVIQRVFTECLLCAWHDAKHWGHC